jgi:energy-coupling factor transporter ATP-binding protein EcfA2
MVRSRRMPLVTLDRVTMAYGHLPLLHEASLRIESRERVCVIGRNGTGKSTLLQIVSGSLAPQSGSVWHERASDDDEVRGVRAEPSPQHVRFDVLTIGNARRRELERLRVRVRPRDGDETERALALRDLFEGRHFARDRIAGLIRTLKSTDEDHGRGGRRTAGNHHRFDRRVRRRQANRPSFAGDGHVGSSTHAKTKGRRGPLAMRRESSARRAIKGTSGISRDAAGSRADRSQGAR